MSQNKIITISRQYGSGGRQIGERLAARLRIPFYDKELILLAARQSGMSEKFFRCPEEQEYTFRGFCQENSSELPISDKIYLAQHSVICTLGEKGSCVIVGSGAGCVLKHVVPTISVFVYADIQVRKKRAIEEYGDNPYRIENHIADIDKKRAAYFKFYAGAKANQMETYNLCIDSGFLGIENAVNLIENLYYLKDVGTIT